MENAGYLGIQMKIKVRTYDIDSAGHVSNIVYFRWLEDLRLQLFEEHFSFQSFVEQGYTPVIAASSIEYKRAIKLFDEPVGHMYLSEIRAASIKFYGEIYVGEQLTTRATHTGVFVDIDTMRPRRTPTALIEKFKQAQELAKTQA
ncbi:MAG: acyl-CoA thioesterase [Candidatus Melainabacteria bacterium]|nr:acyl-CoA thioesterase [Candidatus Melainabacteria bacterium]